MGRKPHRIPPFHSLVGMHLLHLRAAEKALADGDMFLVHAHGKCCELMQRAAEVMRQKQVLAFKARFAKPLVAPTKSGPDSSGQTEHKND